MARLFMRTKRGNIPISPDAVLKYHLEPGMVSPFTRELIVDELGNGRRGEGSPAAGQFENSEGMAGDELAQIDNGVTLHTSEMIDIAQAADSDDG